MNQGNKTRKRIRLRLSGERKTQYRAYPVTVGVPFADGDLEEGTPVCIIDESGTPLPTQTQTLATWNKDLKFVKWLLIDTQADLDKGEEKVIFLEYPAAVPSPQPKQPISVETTGDYITVDTGVMRLVLRRAFPLWKQPNLPDVFAACFVKGDDGWRDVFRGNPGPYLHMKDQFGNVYDSCSGGPAPRIVVEEAGPLRACIRIEGYHALVDQGLRFCPYILRIHLFAGKSDMRVLHTFVYDQEPHEVELAAIGMKFPFDLGLELKAAVGGESALTQEGSAGGSSELTDRSVHWATNWQEMRLLQTDDRHYEVELDGECFGSGEKAMGWASLSGNRGGAAVVIRNCWQEYPKGFVLDQDGIDVQIWPEEYGEALSFTTPFEEPALRFVSESGPIRDEAEVQRMLAENPTAPLNLKSFNIRSLEDAKWVEEVIEKHAKGRTMTYNDTGTESGVGAAKTTEIWVRLSSDRIDDQEAVALAQTVQEPLVAVVDPEHTCATRALGHFYPSGDPRFTQVDQDLDDIFQFVVVDPVESCRLYGMMRYGNMVCSHSSAVGWVYLLYRDNDPAKALRYVGPYNNEAVDQIMSVWAHYARTGEREHLLIAQNYSKCVADVAFVHAHPSDPNRVGLMHYHNGHQWSGGLSPSHSIVSGIMAGYYMTGDKRLLDVAKEAADRIVRTQEPAGILSCRRGVLHREFTGPLSILMDVYQATWEEKYGNVASRSLNWLLRTVTQPGRLPNSVFTRGQRGDEAVVQLPCLPEVAWGNKYHLWEPAMRLFPSKALQDFLMAEADYWVWKSSKDMLNYACTTVCFAYELTGDVSYAAYSKNLIETNFHEFAEGMRKGQHMDFQAIWHSDFIPRLMWVVAHAEAKDPEGFAAAVEVWRDKRTQMPDRKEEVRPDRGPEISLGRLSTAPHPKT